MGLISRWACCGFADDSRSKNLGGGVIWPNSLGFVHVDELGDISPAISTTFLPARAAFMKSIVEAGCGAAKAAEPEPVFKDEGAVNGEAPQHEGKRRRTSRFHAALLSIA